MESFIEEKSDELDVPGETSAPLFLPGNADTAAGGEQEVPERGKRRRRRRSSESLSSSMSGGGKIGALILLASLAAGLLLRKSKAGGSESLQQPSEIGVKDEIDPGQRQRAAALQDILLDIVAAETREIRNMIVDSERRTLAARQSQQGAHNMLEKLRNDYAQFMDRLRSIESQLMGECSDGARGTETIARSIQEQSALKIVHEELLLKLESIGDIADKLEQDINREKHTESQRSEADLLKAGTNQAEDERLIELRNRAQSLSSQIKDIEKNIEMEAHAAADALPTSMVKALMKDIQDAASSQVVSTSVDSELLHKLALEAVDLEAPKLVHAAKSAVNALGPSEVCVEMPTLEKMIDTAIQQHDADKTGKIDYARRVTGGKVISHSPTYVPPDAGFMYKVWDYLNIDTGVGGPNEAISEDVSPTSCWAMNGSEGHITIQLSAPIKIQAVTLEHVSKYSVPEHYRRTAPALFEVHSHATIDAEPSLLLSGSYDIQGPAVQSFTVPHQSFGVSELVTLKILSNHGAKEYTCLYRLRVHGSKQ